MDEDLLPKARRAARARGVSLSRLIEGALRDISEENQPSFAERWQGTFRLAAHDGTRYRFLANKYL
jgi:post-segregation antitoxin (ccd killing protein)